ncbi:ABC-2 type transporter [Gluconobacter morbifer G707]|uniref:ABC-2 type transporter n=1 Tax=Gluconobacter morbifer G707 TaxID=1088869 RepID=G6XLU3_9PROT|nr:ABC-2 type transporter [Gluconobacter morbifer G707]
MGFMKAPVNYEILYLGIFLHMLFCLGTSLIAAPLSEMSDYLEKLVGVLGYLSLPLSGAFTMVDWIKPHYRWILLLSPSVNNVEMIREGQFGYRAHAHYDISYDFAACLVMIVVGLFLTLRVRKYLVVQ